LFVKNHKQKEISDKTNSRYSKKEENGELGTESLKYLNPNLDQACLNNNFSNKDRNSSEEINSSENSNIEDEVKNYFGSEKLSFDAGEKDDNEIFDKENDESSSRD